MIDAMVSVIRPTLRSTTKIGTPPETLLDSLRMEENCSSYSKVLEFGRNSRYIVGYIYCFRLLSTRGGRLLHFVSAYDGAYDLHSESRTMGGLLTFILPQ